MILIEHLLNSDILWDEHHNELYKLLLRKSLDTCYTLAEKRLGSLTRDCSVSEIASARSPPLSYLPYGS
jgi:hypothetical protein